MAASKKAAVHSQTPEEQGAAELSLAEGEWSYIGTAAIALLKKEHAKQQHTLWNTASGRIVGPLHATPTFDRGPASTDPGPGASDWLPRKMGEILARTEVWCDVLSLTAPDGLFLEELQRGLAAVAQNAAGKAKTPVVRMMFGNIIGAPINCDLVISQLTAELPPNSNLQLWVGAWRKGISWNHAKIIAVDGRHLHTGGHNMWDQHYLRINPIHDLSLELEGVVAYDAHMFANAQWRFVETRQSTCLGRLGEKAPDWLPLLVSVRVIVSEHPKGRADEFPPPFTNASRLDRPAQPSAAAGERVPLLTLGRRSPLNSKALRSGALRSKAEPSDGAFLAMIGAARKVIRCSLQDVGPMCFPGTQLPFPGTSWPKPLLAALAEAIWVRNVDVQMILSNPRSAPGGLSETLAAYNNGWTCTDVAAEIIKAIKRRYAAADAGALRRSVEKNLFLCYVRRAKEERGNEWQTGVPIGMHDKHVIIDDVATYIGSQNLYVSDLGEWGVVVDSAAETRRLMREYWEPVWACSYVGTDVNVQEVMDGLHISRDAKRMPLGRAKRQATRALMVQAEHRKAQVGEYSHNPASSGRSVPLHS